MSASNDRNSSSILEHLKLVRVRDHNTAICYFFVTFEELDKQDSHLISRSLIRQLCDQSPHLGDMLHVKDDLNEKSDAAAVNTAFEEAGKIFQQIYVSLDGFDECAELRSRIEVSRILKGIMVTRAECLHVVLTSKWDQTLKDLCTSCGGTIVDLQTHAQEIKNDIKTVVDRDPAFRYIHS